MELQLEGLSKTYGTVQALRKVTYTFKPGNLRDTWGKRRRKKYDEFNLITDNVQQGQRQ